MVHRRARHRRVEAPARRRDLACRLGFDTRRRGHTVSATDLIVAASALRSRAPLLHVDAHFDRIAEVSDLAVIGSHTES